MNAEESAPQEHPKEKNPRRAAAGKKGTEARWGAPKLKMDAVEGKLKEKNPKRVAAGKKAAERRPAKKEEEDCCIL